MYWADLVRVLARRWYVLAPALAVTVVFAVLAVGSVPPHYEVSSTVIVLPPQRAGVPPTNRYAALPLNSVATLLAQSLSSDATRRGTTAAGLGDDYTATITTDGTPVVLLAARGQTQVEARQLVEMLQGKAQSALRDWQSPSPAAEQMSISDLIPAGDPKPLHGSQIRALGAILVLGVVLSVLLALGVDRRAARRRAPEDAPQHLAPARSAAVSRAG